MEFMIVHYSLDYMKATIPAIGSQVFADVLEMSNRTPLCR